MTSPSYSRAPNTGISFDQSSYLERIATALETLATNSTAVTNSIATIDTNISTIATQITTLATQATTLATNSTTITGLATGHGIHFVGPYDWLGLINVYRSLIEQGNIADTQGNVSPGAQAAATALVNSYIAKIQAFPTGF